MKTQQEIVIKAIAYSESIGNEDGTSADHYVMGYTQCQKDMANKKYTEEDIIKAFYCGGDAEDIESFNEFIYSLKKLKKQTKIKI